ncbi:APC family permease [Pseudobdellovibrio sp. HCB154]|uniref:APC family permease n=1 Tax=Pseudobdellovibrio sp. HCB154 TaxID=3386277 RepID=UPI003916FCE1
MFASKIRRILIGDPLHNSQQQHELIPKWKALALLAADALSSIAYATEEIIIPLALSGLAFATTWSLPISLAILGLMFIITLSYRQTIQAYPNGGGAYIVAKDNLGTGAGLVAGAALLIDYTLTVAVSVSAGVENLVSAFPGMAGVQVFTCVWIILFLMVLSLRGVKDSATIFAIPTYLFIFSIFALIITGLVRGPQDVNIHPHTVLMNNLPDIGWILALKAFSSGCTALTGIEAVSNGIPLFRHPQSKNANMTLLMMVVILGSMFAGITYLVNSYDIVKVEGVTLLAGLTKAVFGQGFGFYFVQISIFLILFMAASTAYADFPRLSSLLAIDRYAPRQLISMGDRLVFSNGIIALSMGAIALVIIFRGHTHSLIPLYAVGVFLSFTLSQAGMVVHHWRLREKGWKGSMVMNTIGTLVTFSVLIVIGSFKFTHGAWMVIITIPIIVYAFHRIHVHYVMFARELSQSHYDIDAEGHTKDHVVVIPVSGLHLGVMNAIRYGKSISKDVRVIYVKTDEVSAQRMHEAWAAKFPDMQLHVLDSPYRSISTPILDFIDHVRNENPTDFITVIFPEFVTFKWYHQLLHNQTAWLIKLSLIYKKNVIVTSVKYHLSTT